MAKAGSDFQRYRYRDCHHCFQFDYLYEANKSAITDKITEMIFNGSGIRNTGQVLGISIWRPRSLLKASNVRILTSAPGSSIFNVKPSAFQIGKTIRQGH